MTYKLYFSKQALKDASKIKASHLDEKCQSLLEIVAQNPFSTLPPYEKLVGDLNRFYSRRINIQHRLIYEVIEDEKIVKILKIWSHYE